MRSSGRIPKEIPILLIGSDLDGRVFSEQTKTVVLSLHGAGIVSRYKLSPEQELVLRWTEKNKETEIRVVGHLGSNEDRHTYGVAFFDQEVNFWETNFPPITAVEIKLGLLTLACVSCSAVEHIDNASVEADVVATNGGVLRSCKHCGAVTLWKPAPKGAHPAIAPTPLPASPAPIPPSLPAASNSSSGSSQLPLFETPSPLPATTPPPQTTSTPPPLPLDDNPEPTPNYTSETPDSFISAASGSPNAFDSQPQNSSQTAPQSSPQASNAAQHSAYSGAFIESQSSVATLPPPPAVNSTPAPLVSPSTPRANRRKHPRVKVNYSACIRHPDRGDDIVQCEDMSKGGLRFKSRLQYYVQSVIDVAVPYVKGQPAIFVSAQIVFVEELSEQRLYRYGVQYLNSTKPRGYS